MTQPTPHFARTFPPPEARPLLAVDVVVFTVVDTRLEVLLVRRDAPPVAEETWGLPGGFVRLAEGLEAAALRELAEATGATDVYLEQLFTFGEPDRDPRGRVVSVIYFALVSADKLALCNRPNGATAWHHMYCLPPTAFDHARILDYALRRLRYKLEYTAAAFQLLPAEFTLSELQDVYAIILDEPELDKRNFRKKLLKNGVVVPTSRFRQTGGRPARLYRFSDEQPFEFKAPRLFP